MSTADENTIVYGIHAGEIYRYATTTTHAVYTTPTAWRGRKVLFHAIDQDMWLVFGPTNAVEADRSATSTVLSTVLTPTATTAKHIPVNGYYEFDVDSINPVTGVWDMGFFSVEAAGNGFWEAARTSR